MACGNPAFVETVVVNGKAAQRLRRNVPWCYRAEVIDASTRIEKGAIVRVVDAQKSPIGQAFWASTSPIALRLLTRESDERIDDAFFRRRIEASIARRRALGRESYRAVHGESDLLPGLFVDRYGDGITIQTLSEGADARKELFGRIVADLLSPRVLALRDDGSGRDFEGLVRERRLLIGAAPARVMHREGENAFEVDLLEDMKTGSFLDQVDNHLRAGQLATGDALDCFSYHGGFALAMAVNARSVVAIEQDEHAARRARENGERNRRANVKVEHANAFDLLHRYDDEGRKFDTIVIDPPGLAKRNEGVKTALRAYRELNLRGLKCLRPNGLLFTCSCSGKLSREEFEQLVLAAAQDARRTIQILERRGAGFDHPVLATLDESEYLKVLVVRAL